MRLTLSLFVQLLIVGSSLNTFHAAQADSIKKFNAEYTVPVSDEALKPYARFVLDSYTVETNSQGATTLSFIMPDDLSAGEVLNLKFTETEKNATSRVLEGEYGVVKCTIPWLKSECRVEFSRKAVPKRGDAVEHILKKYTLGDGWMERLEVLNQFSTDPIGIVVVTGQ